MFRNLEGLEKGTKKKDDNTIHHACASVAYDSMTDDSQMDVAPDLRITTIWDEGIQRDIQAKVGRPLRDRKVNKERVVEDLQHAYLAVGGAERLAHEANQDFKWFANKFMKPGILLPNEKTEVDVNYQILPAIPRSPLDGEYTDVTTISAAGGEGTGDAPSGEDPPAAE